MARKEGKSGETAALNPAMDALIKMQTAGLGPLGWMGQAWLDTLGELGGEVTQFVADRIKEDVRTQHAILHCKSPAELQEIQSAFMERAIEDYAAETGRLVEIGERMFNKTRS